MNREEFLIEMVSHMWFEVTFTRNLLVDLIEKNQAKINMWSQDDVLKAQQTSEKAIMECLEEYKKRSEKIKEEPEKDEKKISVTF